MDLQSIERGLRGSPAAAATALAALRHHNNPLSEREAATLAAFHKERAEQAAAGMLLGPVPEDMLALAGRPAQPLHALAAVMAAWAAAARAPSVSRATQTALRQSVVPTIVATTPLDAREWAAALTAVAAQVSGGGGAAGPLCPPAAAKMALLLLELAAPAMLVADKAAAAALSVAGPHRVKGVAAAPRKETRQPPGLKEVTPEEAAAKWLAAASAVLRAAARRHANSSKHTLRNGAAGGEGEETREETQEETDDGSNDAANQQQHQKKKKSKKSKKDGSSDSEVFLRSSVPRRLRRVLETCEVTPAAFAAAAATLAPVDAVAVSLVAPLKGWEGGVALVTQDVITRAVKAAPGELALLLLGGTGLPVPGSLRFASDGSTAAEDTVRYALYTMGLTHTTLPMFEDLVAVLLSAPPAAVAAALAAPAPAGPDAAISLLTPFVNNPKVMTDAVAAAAAPLYARLLLSVSHAAPAADDGKQQQQQQQECAAAVFANFTTAAATTLQSRCRAPPEKTTVMTLVSAVLRGVPATHPGRAAAEAEAARALVPLLEREAAVPLAPLVSATLRLAATLKLEGALATGIAAARKAAAADAAVRRALLLHLSPARVPAGALDDTADVLLAQCEDVIVDRPDAFLALLFAADRIAAQQGAEGGAQRLRALTELLGTAEVLAAAAPRNDDSADAADARARAAEVAIHLARTHGIYGPFALLLTHPGGDVRRLLLEALFPGAPAAAVSGGAAPLVASAETARALWDAIATNVFGISAASPATAAPALLSDSADVALAAAGALVVKFAKELGPAAVAELLLCSGHDSVQTRDAHFYAARRSGMHGLPRDCTRVRRGPFEKLFPIDHKPLLLAPEVLPAMRAWLADAREHVGTAAARAVVLLLGAVPAASAAAVTDALAELLKESEAYFVSLDERDRALATEDAAAIGAYEDGELRAQHLLKTYTERPPKGMSEDDYADLKKKDAAALAQGRETLRAQLAKRAAELRAEARRHKLAYQAVQLLGTDGRYPVECVSTLYPLLWDQLRRHFTAAAVLAEGSKLGGSNASKKEREAAATAPPAVVATLAEDAVWGLLSRTPLAALGPAMTDVSARTHDARSLSKADVARVSTIAQQLRQTVAQMLPAPFTVVLLAFARVAFKAGRGPNAMATTISVPTQHQIVSVVLNNVGQPGLPLPTECLRLFSDMLQSFPALYKNVLQGFQALIPMIPVEHLTAIERSMFLGSDAVREVTAATLGRFSFFGRSRRALVLAAVFARDGSVNVAKNCGAITASPAHAFALELSDWGDLMYFLRAYGHLAANAQRLALPIRDLFARPDTREDERQQLAWAADITAIGGLGAVEVLRSLSPLLRPAVYPCAMDFLCGLLESPDTPAALLSPVLAAGRVLLKDAGEPALRAMAPELQERLSRPPKDASAAHKELYQASAAVWLTIISCRLGEVALLEAIIEQQSKIVNNSSSAMVHRCVCDGMVEITRLPAVRASPALDEFMNKCLKQVLHSGSYVKKKAHAMGAVGVLKGLGLPALGRYEVVAKLREAAAQKQVERSGAMVLMEALCEVLGRRFEPYALQLSGILLEGVADSDPKVSECADDAAKMMMSRLTTVGIRQIVPHLIRLLGSEQAKKRVAPLNLIGYVAYCAPRQLATTLPEIMKHIQTCLFDVNGAVAGAAFTALGKVAGVVLNPEVREHVDLILAAMRSPSTETEPALDALLYTRFINVIDPASLALVAPVLVRGLGAQLPHARPKAAQIVASMVHLVADAQSLVPYKDELVEQLQGCTQDPRNETRTTAAKAIAGLTAALGGGMVDDMCRWAFSVLERVQAGSVEKAGAAQVFVEVVNACGEELLSVYGDAIEKGMRSEKPPVREGFLYIMVYAPSGLAPEVFHSFLPIGFPWVLESLSHFSDKVRDVALSAGDTIISLYGTRNLPLVLGPLLDGVVSEVTTLRHSSLLLASKLLLHVVASIKKKMRLAAANAAFAAADEEAAKAKEAAEAGATDVAADTAMDENGVLTIESARDAESRGISIIGTLEDMLGTADFVRLLSAIFCGRNEHSVDVRTDCNLAWTTAVASIRAAVNKIFDGLVQLLVRFASSENPDCCEVAQSTIEFTCRMQETIDRFIVNFCDTFKEAGDAPRPRLGALAGLTSVLPFAGSRVMQHGGEIVGVLLPGMEDADPEVQRAAREAFAKVSRSSGARLVEGAVEAQLGVSVRGVLEVVKVKPDVALQMVYKYLAGRAGQHAEYDVELLEAVLRVEEAATDLARYNDETVRLLLEMLTEGLEGAAPVLTNFVAVTNRAYLNSVTDRVKAAMNVPAHRRGALLAAGAYACGTELEDTEGISVCLRALIDALGDAPDDTRLTAVRLLPQVLERLEGAVTAGLDEEAQADVPACKRAAGRYLIQYLDLFRSTVSATARAYISSDTPSFAVLAEGDPRIFEVLMNLYYRGLDYGTPMQRVEAVECIQDLLEFAPRPLSAAAANTIAGRCSKVLFVKNEGEVVLALVRLCLQLLQYPASGKEKMVESTMALAMFGAVLCDSPEARALTLRVVTVLLSRSERYADLILGNVVSKRSAVDTPLLRTVLCRFVSVVIRYSNFERALMHIPKLMEAARAAWDGAETAALAAAGGVAVGALCRSASISDDAVTEIKERTLRLLATRGTGATGGFAAVYALVRGAPARVDPVFLEQAAEHLRAAAGFGSGCRTTTNWLIRAAAAVAATGAVSAAQFNVAAYVPLLRKVNASDEGACSSAQFFYDSVQAAYGEAATAPIEEFPREQSRQWAVMGHFDADFDDEMEAGVTS